MLTFLRQCLFNYKSFNQNLGQFTLYNQGLLKRLFCFSPIFISLVLSNSVNADGKNIVIKGMITVRGITKPLVLNAQLLRAPGTKLGERENLRMRITGQINRHDFGASGFPNDVGEMLGIKIDAQIKRQ